MDSNEFLHNNKLGPQRLHNLASKFELKQVIWLVKEQIVCMFGNNTTTTTTNTTTTTTFA